MELNLSLDTLKFANVVNFTRNFGTKKTSGANGGSLTTFEFNTNNALPFDLQRPIVITESSTVSNVQYDAKLLINNTGIEITLGTGTDGITLTVASLYNATITDGAVNYTIRAGQTLQFMFFDTSWHKLTEGEYFGTVADATTQIIDVAVSNYTGKKLPEGARLYIIFSSDYSYDGQPSFTINGGTEQVPVTVGNVPAGIGAFQSGKSYEFVFTGTSYDCLSSNVVEQILNDTTISGHTRNYKKYIDGRIEQWGLFTGGTNSGIATFLRPFSDTNYVVSAAINTINNNTLHTSIKDKKINQVAILSAQYLTSPTNASGYIHNYFAIGY